MSLISKKLANAAASGEEQLEPFLTSITTNQQEIDLATYATNNGWDGVAPAEITIDSGVFVFSNNTSVPALTTGNFPNGLTLIVNGFIAGKGGQGGDDSFSSSPDEDGKNGGPALSLGCDVIIIGGTGGYIGGGGGGGGADGASGAGGAGGGDNGDGDGLGGGPGETGGDGDGGGSADRIGEGGGAGGGGGGDFS